MPKTKISEFSATPANNTDIDSINIAEGCAPSGINDAIRELMAQLKDFQTGAVGDSFNGPIGTTTAAAGAFTTLSSTGNTTLGDASGDAVTINGTATFANANPTLTAGTANGVTYLNGSKVLTSGSLFTYNGTSAQIGDSLSAADGSSFYVYGNIPASTQLGIKIAGNATTYAQQAIRFYDTYSEQYAGYVGFTPSSLTFGQGTTEGMRLTSTGLGIGTTTATAKLTVINTADANKQIVFGDSATYYGSVGHNSGTGLNEYRTESSGGHGFFIGTSGTANMTLNSSGNLGIGTSSPTDSGGFGRAVDALGPDGAAYYARATSSGTYGGVGHYTTAGGTTYLMNNGTGPTLFTLNGAERARITADGKFGINTSSPDAFLEVQNSTSNFPASRIQCTNASYTSQVVQLRASRNTTDETFFVIRYFNDGAGAYKFNVADSGNVTNTNGSYGTISDVKMKTDIVDAGSQWADIKAVRFRKFKMKDDPAGLVQLGVVAQELEQTSPGLVDEHVDRDAEGNDLGTTTKSVKTSILLMKAAKALQEAMVRIETLEAKVSALEGN